MDRAFTRQLVEVGGELLQRVALDLPRRGARVEGVGGEKERVDAAPLAQEADEERRLLAELEQARGRLDIARAERSPEAETQWPDAVECLETLEGIALTGAWTDLGSWQAVWDYGPRDDNDNYVDGPAQLRDVRHCLVVTDRPLRVAGLVPCVAT